MKVELTYDELCVVVEAYARKVASGMLGFTDLNQTLTRLAQLREELVRAWKERK